MNTNAVRKLLAAILTLIGAAVLSSPVYSQDPPTIESVLTIFPVQTQVVGAPITITTKLSSIDGKPNPNKVLILYLNGENIRRIRTDDQGMASIRIAEELLPAEYTVRVVFDGTRAYLPTSATTMMEVRPAELTIVTIPPLANIPFALDGQLFTSDEQGVARFKVSKPGDYQLNVRLEPDFELSPDTRVTFDRWKDDFQPQRTVTMKGDLTLQVGFSISHRVSQKFVDLDNKPVAMTRIETLTLQGTDGSKFTFEDGRERWLRAGRIARRQEGLELSPIQYSIESVLINGSNVVNRYQQRFFVEPDDVWSIQLLLYYANFSAADALFGSPIGTGIKVEYPDGHTETLQFGVDNKIRIGPVPRGEYKVQVVGASGVAPVTPLALSRNQELDLKVLSNLNIGLGLGVGIAGVFGLLLYGRPHLPRLAFRTTKNIATLSFLKSGVAPQYLLPETVTPNSGGSAGAIVLLPPAHQDGPLTEIERAVVVMAHTEPLFGRRRVSNELKKLGIIVSPYQVRAIQKRYNLGTVESRLSGHSAHQPTIPGPFRMSNFSSATDTLRTLVKSKIDMYKHPGYLCAQDTFHVGLLEGIGEVFQQTFIDVYSGVVWVKLYDKKNSKAATDMLLNTVGPMFAAHNIAILNVLTDRGREFVATGWQKNHHYENALSEMRINHITTDSQDPQNNEICRIFHDAMYEGFYKKIQYKRRKPFKSLDSLQDAVDKWLTKYNSEHVWSGNGNYSVGRADIDRGQRPLKPSNDWQILNEKRLQQLSPEAAFATFLEQQV